MEAWRFGQTACIMCGSRSKKSNGVGLATREFFARWACLRACLKALLGWAFEILVSMFSTNSQLSREKDSFQETFLAAVLLDVPHSAFSTHSIPVSLLRSEPVWLRAPPWLDKPPPPTTHCLERLFRWTTVVAFAGEEGLRHRQLDAPREESAPPHHQPRHRG